MVSTTVYAILSYDGSMLDCALNYAAIAVIHLSLVVYLHNLKVGSYKWIWIPLLGFLFLFQVMLFPHHNTPFSTTNFVFRLYFVYSLVALECLLFGAQILASIG